MESKEIFLQKNKIADKFHELEIFNPDLWDTMREIYEDYENRLKDGSYNFV